MRSITISWTHEEPLGFVPIEVDYEITGNLVSAYRPATYNDPAEGGEVEIDGAVRRDPFTGVETATDEWRDWPSDELEKIEQAVFDAFMNAGPDEPDFDPDDYRDD